MFCQKFLLPAFALLGAVSAQSSVCTAATVTINSQADATALASCKTVKGSILIGPDAANIIDISGPGQVTGNITSANAGNLISLTSSTITNIGGEFSLFNMTLMSTLQFTELTSVGTIFWSALPALSSLTLPGPITQSNSVTITNTFLTTLKGIDLMTVGTLNINNNKRLTTFTAQIANITSSLTISANSDQLDVEFPKLVWAADMTFRNVAKLNIPSLATVNDSLTIDESTLTDISLSNLTTVGSFANKAGGLSLIGNTALTNITFSLLNSVGGGMQIANNSLLQTVSFPALTQVGGALDLAGNFTTPSLPALENVQGALNIQSTATIDCSKFTALDGNVVQGKDNCVSATDDPTSITSGTSTSSGPKSSGSKGAAASYSLDSRSTIGLSVLGGLLGLLV